MRFPRYLSQIKVADGSHTAETPSKTEFMYSLEAVVTNVHDDRAGDTHTKRVCVVPLNMPCTEFHGHEDENSQRYNIDAQASQLVRKEKNNQHKTMKKQ
jgi:hypothetical protein